MSRLACALVPAVMVGAGVGLVAHSETRPVPSVSAVTATRAAAVANVASLPVGSVIPESDVVAADPQSARPATVVLPGDRQASKAVVRRGGMTISALGKTDPLVVRSARDGAQIVVTGYHVVTLTQSSRRPGSAHGTSALWFHRDGSAGQSDMSPLVSAKAGTHVVVTVGGRRFTYAVTKTQQVDKDHMPLALLDSTGPPRLGIVSCSGAMVRGPHGWGHTGRTVIWAALVR